MLGRGGFKTQHQRRETEGERRSLCACAEKRCMGGAFVRLCGGDNSEVQQGVDKEWQKQVTSRARTVMEGEPLGQHNLDLKIIRMLLRPNKTWEGKRRADHLVPTGYFS